MKKTAIFSLLLLGLSFTSCDEVEDMTGVAQTNPEIPAYDLGSLAVSSPMGNTLSIAALNEAGQDKVAVLMLSNPGNLPEGYSIAADYTIGNEGYENSVTYPVVFDGETGYITTDEVVNAYKAIYGITNDMNVLYGRAEVYAKNAEGSVIRLGGDNTYYGEVAFECTPDFSLNLYTPGNSNGWSQTASMMLYTTDGGTKYEGFAYLDGEFKLTNQDNWDGINYGAGDTEGTISETGGNLNAETPGMYWLKVNVEELTISMTLISQIGAIGGFNSWNGDAVLDLNADHTAYTGTVDFGDGGEWKLRANGDWALSWGGSMDDMIENAGNLQAPGTGVWNVTFNIGSLPYTITCNQ